MNILNVSMYRECKKFRDKLITMAAHLPPVTLYVCYKSHLLCVDLWRVSAVRAPTIRTHRTVTK